MKDFDECEVKQVVFSEVKILHRFFNDNGEGFTKSSDDGGYNDHSFHVLDFVPSELVWVKTK